VLFRSGERSFLVIAVFLMPLLLYTKEIGMSLLLG
jgi:hypothetical protein